jgi:hypothetical protein
MGRRSDFPQVISAGSLIIKDGCVMGKKRPSFRVIATEKFPQAYLSS